MMRHQNVAPGEGGGFRYETGAQVWAREKSTRAWVYLPPGTADTVRPDGLTWKAYAKAGNLLCGYPGCAVPFASAHGGVQKRHHFVHPKGGVSHAETGGELIWHLTAKETVRAWAAGAEQFQGWAIHVDDVPIVMPEGWRRPDVLLISPDEQRRIAFEVQYSELTGSQWLARHRHYERAGVVDIWLFAPIPGPLWRRPRNVPRHNDALFRGTWEISTQLSPVHATMLEEGRVPLWLDPSALAVGTATAQYRRTWFPTRDTEQLWARRKSGTPSVLVPEPDFAACWVSSDALATCTVDMRTGELETPTRRLQRSSLERDQRAEERWRSRQEEERRSAAAARAAAEKARLAEAAERRSAELERRQAQQELHAGERQAALSALHTAQQAAASRPEREDEVEHEEPQQIAPPVPPVPAERPEVPPVPRRRRSVRDVLPRWLGGR
ncbi:competence protein CoiA family protein [Kitasatospora kifunensis]|uniref:Competence protein CoiA nuclease-like domain-containing protein n=1 Tax=Kitasatospora kifunensis TaxID=58351 RepID=A0A7W7RBX3_KITKI|nr:competence protein CoiA family protein [Kitasatospora kifunensis]MBB4929132.1 hypothetical protein [Kitasatospora kifunensis]